VVPAKLFRSIESLPLISAPMRILRDLAALNVADFEETEDGFKMTNLETLCSEA
jgi:hypothetical protein